MVGRVTLLKPLINNKLRNNVTVETKLEGRIPRYM
jgi:hypothetical protein